MGIANLVEVLEMSKDIEAAYAKSCHESLGCEESELLFVLTSYRADLMTALAATCGVAPVEDDDGYGVVQSDTGIRIKLPTG